MRKCTFKEALAIAHMISGGKPMRAIYWRWMRLRRKLIKRTGYCSIAKTAESYNITKIFEQTECMDDINNLLVYYSDRFSKERVCTFHLCIKNVKRMYAIQKM